jgi:hypothetical protein
MSSLTVRASGPATVPTVWEAYADPQRWPEWSPHIHRVDAVGRLRPGLEGQVGLPLLPRLVDFVVTAVDAKGGRWSWQAALGPLRMSFDHGVEAKGAGSGTWLTMHGPLPILVLYAPLARLALHRLVRTRTA